MTSVGVHEAKTNFSRLLRQVAMGEEIEICSSGKPIARLVPITLKQKRTFGVDVGVFALPDDFNDALTYDVLSSFE